MLQLDLMRLNERTTKQIKRKLHRTADDENDRTNYPSEEHPSSDNSLNQRIYFNE